MLKKIFSVLGFITILVVAAIGGSIGRQIGKEVFSVSKPSTKEIDEKLIEGFTKTAEQLNKRGPIMIDTETSWDRSEVGPGARLTYYYSFPNYSSRDIKPDWLHTNVIAGVKKNVCENKKMTPSLQYGATYVYVYSGNDGKEIARCAITKNDCN